MSMPAITRRRLLWGLGGTAGLLAGPAFASGTVVPFKLEVTKIDVYGTRDPQLMALPSLAEVSGYFKDEGLTVGRHFVASAGELPNMLASGNISMGCGGVTMWMYSRQPKMKRNTQMMVGMTVHVISSVSLCAADGSDLWPGRWRYLMTK